MQRSHHNKKYLLSEQEIQDLLTFCNNIEHGRFWSCVITTLRYTGIRLRQLVGLAWSDFDLENGRLILRTSSSKTKREYTVKPSEILSSAHWVSFGILS
ncbi:tyrosine-type recombinase/integrase [bacterium endosymbiont of Bathymodiolus sp. 5 South]|uniref:tyrosine-type recombinase/integrase n=1 Tax=bacterium endosymbiont of Bathymodiolus sp. 5 South TaxID=1181670 RepID=UPI0012520DB4|nr:hypothetical protein BSPWISOXPB_6366 [uncultured Gammaproteobacteria bacterium]